MIALFYFAPAQRWGKDTAMKIFISQPMRGRSDEEIQTEREKMIDAVKRQYGEAEELDTFFQP